jgi:hypothetical protein
MEEAQCLGIGALVCDRCCFAATASPVPGESHFSCGAAELSNFAIAPGRRNRSCPGVSGTAAVTADDMGWRNRSCTGSDRAGIVAPSDDLSYDL